MLTLTPISLKDANAFVAQHHRHHRPVTGHKFSIACAEAGRLAGCALDWLAANAGRGAAAPRRTYTRRR